MIKQTKKISIIVPVYNVKEYLSECIESVINQTYSNIELLLINDASTDNSIDICKKYAKKYKNIKLIDNKINGGLAHVRNMGLKESTGEYIMFLDSDDMLYKNAVQKLYMEITKNNASLAIGKLNSFNSKGEYGYYSDKYLNKYFVGKIEDNMKLLNCISCCSKLYKSSFAKKYKFLEKTAHEDNSFTLLCYFNANKIVVVPEYFYYRRIRETNDSIMQNLNIKTFNGLMSNFEFVLNNLKNQRYGFLEKFIAKKTSNYIIMNLKKDEYKEAYNYSLNIFEKEQFTNNSINYFKLRFNICKFIFSIIRGK